MDDLKKARMIKLNEMDGDKLRKSIIDYFQKTYSIDEKLYEVLANEDSFYHRFEPLRHPLIFYLGHTAAFYTNKLIIAKVIEKRINPRFESIFAVGVDEMSWDDLDEKNYDWPTLLEVREYRKKVYHFILELIHTLPLNPPISWDSAWWAIIMAIEHERIHLETSSVIIRQAPLNYIIHQHFWESCEIYGDAPENELISVNEKTVKLGKDKNSPLYGWDNEYGAYEKNVQSFKASKYLVSNKEFLGFVEDKGYKEKRFWTEEGWEWVCFRQSDYPLFWIKNGKQYKFRTMTKIIDMPWNWPVEVNYLEAKAFCQWLSEKKGKSIRLPSEEEWHSLINEVGLQDFSNYDKMPGNIHLEYWASSCPIDYFPFGDFYDVIGNVWQWTETEIRGFKGFEVHPFYDDFSTPTFDGKHNIIKGGSWISTGNVALPESRYAFRRHFYQHAGFRYVESSLPVENAFLSYETDREIAALCDSHWGNDSCKNGNFFVQCSEYCFSKLRDTQKDRALILGASAGRLAFEISRHFQWVTALDFSARFIRPAIQMKENGILRYALIEEGEIISYHEKRLEDFYSKDLISKIEFWQADPANLKPQFKNYQCVIIDDILAKMVNPVSFLEQIIHRMRSHAIMIIISSNDWKEELVRKENWIGGFRKDGEPYYTLEGLKDYLSQNFSLMDQSQEMKRIIRIHKWKSVHSINQITIWKKKN